MAITEVLSDDIKDGSIVNDDIAVGAAIVESKLNLNFATHSNANDPTTDQKAALAGNSPSGTNKYATMSDVAGISGSYAAPVQTVQNLRDVAEVDRADKQMRLVEDKGAIYRFDSAGTGTDDGDAIIAPTTGTGRWFRVTATSAPHTHDSSQITDWGTTVGDQIFTEENYVTTADDLTTAVDKLDMALKDLELATDTAADIAYDNATSGMVATDVQAAIDEVEGRVDTAETDIGNLQDLGVAKVDSNLNSGLTGTINGTNKVFTLSATPVSSADILVFRGSLPQYQGAAGDYEYSAPAGVPTITFVKAPANNSNVQVYYFA